MKNLRLRYKFIIIILLSALPAAFATYLMAKEATGSIHFAADELTGSLYLQSLKDLHSLVGEHRIAYMSSLVDNSAQRVEVNKRIVDSIKHMNEVHAKLHVDLDLGDSWTRLRANIEALMGTASGLDYDAAASLHDETIALMNAITQSVADNSNLILDPELDSFYLMDAVVLKILPAIATLNSYTVEFSEKNGFMHQLPHLYTLEKIGEFKALASESVNIAIGHNPVLAQALDGINNEFQQHYSTALASLEKVRVNSTPELQKQAFSDSITVMNTGYELFDIVNRELDKLLEIRIKKDTRERNSMIAFVLAAVGIAMIFTFIVGRSITNTVITAKNLAEAIADDQLDNIVCSRGRDEPAQLMTALALMQDKLNERISQERQQSIINGRIKQALECVSSPVLVTDVDKRINYSNIAANQFFQRFEDALAADIQGFSHKDILGQPMDFLCRCHHCGQDWI